MKLKEPVLLLLLLLLIASCQKENEVYKSKFTNSIDFKYSNKITVKYTNNNYIGRIKEFLLWENKLVISDNEFKCIWLLDSNYNIISKLGREGKAPNEFVSSPNLIAGNDSLYLFDFQSKRLSVYDNSMNLANTINLSASHLVYPSRPILVNNNFKFNYTIEKL